MPLEMGAAWHRARGRPQALGQTHQGSRLGQEPEGRRARDDGAAEGEEKGENHEVRETAHDKAAEMKNNPNLDVVHQGGFVEAPTRASCQLAGPGRGGAE